MYRLVVIDDEYIVVQGIKALISRLKLDYEVVGAAYDGIQGLEVIRSEKPDVVITDIRIPGLDGLSVIEAAKEECPDTYFIVISGYSEFVYAQRALTLGVKDYIDKPVTADKLKKALTRIEDEWAKTRHEDNRKAQANREKFQELERTFERSVKCITDCDAAAFREECRQAIRCLQELYPELQDFRREFYKHLCVLASLIRFFNSSFSGISSGIQVFSINTSSSRTIIFKLKAFFLLKANSIFLYPYYFLHYNIIIPILHEFNKHLTEFRLRSLSSYIQSDIFVLLLKIIFCVGFTNT